MRPDPGALPDETKEAPSDPLRFDLPWGGNIAYTPRSGYGTPFFILRSLAEQSPVISLCIQCRKDQMAALDWDFAPRDKKVKDGSMDTRIAAARAFMAKPDGVTPFPMWMQMAVDEILTIDALSIYRRPTIAGAVQIQANRAYQLKPDEIYGYEIKDGSTFKLLLNNRGELPLPPQIAYRQIIKGAPLSGGDLTQHELLYLPKTVRTWTPYGRSPIESALLIVLADINRAMFNVAYYTDGNIPEALVGVPDTWQPKQIKQWNEYWDLLLRGDPKNRNKLRFVVQSMAKTVHEFKKPDFTTTYDLWLLKLQCALFGVTPSEIGFTDDVNKATSKSQGDVNQRRGVKPMARFIKYGLDIMLAERGFSDIETTWSGGEGEDALAQAKIVDLGLRNGRISLDEQRLADGNTTIGAGPAVITATGPVFWEDVIAASEAAGVPDTGGADNPDEPLPPAVEDQTADTTAQIAQQAELKKYQQVATKALRAGKPVPVFTSTILSPRFHAALEQKLAAMTTVGEAQQLFARARGAVSKSQSLSRTQKQQQTKMRDKLTSVLASQGAAVAKHVADGIA